MLSRGLPRGSPCKQEVRGSRPLSGLPKRPKSRARQGPAADTLGRLLRRAERARAQQQSRRAQRTKSKESGAASRRAPARRSLVVQSSPQRQPVSRARSRKIAGAGPLSADAGTVRGAYVADVRGELRGPAAMFRKSFAGTVTLMSQIVLVGRRP